LNRTLRCRLFGHKFNPDRLKKLKISPESVTCTRKGCSKLATLENSRKKSSKIAQELEEVHEWDEDKKYILELGTHQKRDEIREELEFCAKELDWLNPDNFVLIGGSKIEEPIEYTFHLENSETITVTGKLEEIRDILTIKSSDTGKHYNIPKNRIVYDERKEVEE